MATVSNTINTRIKNRFSTYGEWTTANPTLEKGEIAIVQVPASTGVSTTEPAYLMKVGDGSTAFNALDWTYAKASDVHEWAKMTKANFMSWVAGTRHTTDGFTLDAAITALEETVNGKDGKGGHEQRIVALEALLGEGDGSVADQIADAIAALDLGNTYATKGEAEAIGAKADAAQDAADANAEAIAVLNGNADTTGSVAKQIADAQADLDGKIALKADASALQTTDGKVAALEETVNTGHEGRLAALEGTITGLSGAMHFKGVETKLPTDVSGYADGDVIVVGEKEYVFNKGAFVEFGDVSAEGERIEALEGKLDGVDKVTDYVAAQIAAAGHATSAELEAAQGALEAEIAKKADQTALDATDEKVAALEGKVVLNGHNTVQAYVEAVKSELAEDIAENASGIATLNGDATTDGSVAKAVKDAVDGLATVAKTGDVGDLIQADGEYIIFNCGNATGW